jgi:hypothetical protein
MANPWLEHLKEFQKKHPEKSYGECMKLAKATYKPIEKQSGKGKSKESKKIEKNAVGALDAFASVGKDHYNQLTNLFDPKTIEKTRERQKDMDFFERIGDNLQTGITPVSTYKSLSKYKPVSKSLKGVPILSDVARAIGLGHQESLQSIEDIAKKSKDHLIKNNGPIYRKQDSILKM